MIVSLYCRPGFSIGFTGSDGRPKVIAGECTLEGQDWEKAKRFDNVKSALASGYIWEGAESLFRTADAGRIELADDGHPPANDPPPADTEDREG